MKQPPNRTGAPDDPLVRGALSAAEYALLLLVIWNAWTWPKAQEQPPLT